ncbi:PAS domain S-box protein [Paradesertivirga mongoliensis]|uniref:histidine kinase n=1 Tax=Paradesertivirga mongoliensis TaxID=2100740 RepID=A0ABW4ZGM8_9SPHI|nr:PAS domain S-box protein [Pedobacter mongoliensis]
MNLNAVEFLDLSQELFCVLGTDGYLTRVNRAFQEAVGYCASELQSEPFVHFLHKDDRVSFRSYCKALESGLTVAVHENRFHCADGSCKWFSWKGAKPATENCIYAFIRDVSDQKHLEEQLQRELQTNRDIFDSLPDMVCSFDSQGIFLSVNQASERILGYSPEEMLGRSFIEFLHPADKEITLNTESDLLAGIEFTNIENRYMHKNGSIVWMAWSSVWSAERQTYYGIGRNAAERKKREDEIKFNEKRYKELVQTGSDVVVILDIKGVCLYTSPSVTNVLGYDPQFLTGMQMCTLIHPDYQPIIETAVKTVSQQFRVELPLFKFKNAKGEWRWIQTILTNLINEDTINGIVANSKDVTEQIGVEEQKEKAISRVKNLIENYTQGYFSLDKDWVIKEVNPATIKLLNMPEEMLLNQSLSNLFPNHESNFYKQYEIAVRENRFVEFEEKMFSSNRWFQIAAYPYEGGLTVFFKEITAEKLQQLLVNLEKDVLEFYIGGKTTLQETANCYLHGLADIYNFKCFLSLYDRNKCLLVPFSAPGLPSEYLDPLQEGFAIAPDMGSCGAAAFAKELCIVRDISTHPNYGPFKEALIKNDLRSCWSLPLIDASDKLLGTLAVYHNIVKTPDDQEKDLVKRVGAFLQILIESHQVKQNLLVSNDRYKYISLATQDATYDWNLLNEYIYWGESTQKLFGYTEKKCKIGDWEYRLHPAERLAINKSLDDALNDPEITYWHQEYRYRRADGSYAFVSEDGYILRDQNGSPERMVGALKDISKLKESAHQILKQNKRLQEIATINSHHIRKPLANILGIIHALKGAEEEHMSELLSLLEQSGDELDKIVRKIAKKTLV